MHYISITYQHICRYIYICIYIYVYNIYNIYIYGTYISTYTYDTYIFHALKTAFFFRGFSSGFSRAEMTTVLDPDPATASHLVGPTEPNFADWFKRLDATGDGPDGWGWMGRSIPVRFTRPGELTVCNGKWPSRNSGFSHEKW